MVGSAAQMAEAKTVHTVLGRDHHFKGFAHADSKGRSAEIPQA